MFWLELGLSTMILAAAGLSLVVMRRNLRYFRALKAEPRDWNALEPARKKAIRRALWRGEAVEDQREAEIVLDLVEREKRVRHLLRPLHWIYTPLLAVFLVVGILSSEWRFLAWIGGGTLILSAVLSPVTWYHRRQVSRAVTATRRLFAP